jgi:TatD DNase family protein
MSFIDAHAHLTSDENPELTALLERAYSAGVTSIVNICTELDDLKRGILLAKKPCTHTPRIYTVASLTPHEAKADDALFFKEIEKFAHAKELVAIGETGLDYHYDLAPKDVQAASFRRYLLLAKATGLPIVIHCREAFDDLCAIIKETAPDIKVMLHCFTGTLDEAKRAASYGWYISMSGIVTFKKSEELQKVAKNIPNDLLLIETDSPYLAPQGFRGKTNEPAYLVHTAQFVAGLRNQTLDEIAELTTQNTKRLFHGIS